MTRRPHAVRIGIFAVVGLAILLAALVAVFGSRIFKPSERAQMAPRKHSPTTAPAAPDCQTIS